MRWTPPGKMRWLVTIEQLGAPTVNAYGEVVDVWTALGQTYAAVEEITTRQYFAARAVQSAVTHQIHCRYLAGVDNGMRVVWEGNHYYIENVTDLGYLHRELEILATAKVPETQAPLSLSPIGIAPRLVARLTSDAGVSAIVATRVRPVKLHRTDPYPAIVYRVTNDAPLNGAGGEDLSGTETASVSIECLARSYADAKGLAKTVRTCLSGWRDLAGSPPVSMAHLDPEADQDVDLEPSQDAGVYSVLQTYLFNFAK